MYAFMNHIKTQKVRIEKTATSISLRETDDVTVLNREQRQIFDRVMSHYLVADETRLLLQMNDQADTEKFIVIDLIFAHLTFYAAQDSSNQAAPDKSCDPVLRAASTGVAAYNIAGCTLHSLLKLPVQTPFNDLSGDNLAKLQMARQFRETLSQLRDDPISQANWKFLLKRAKNKSSNLQL